MVNGTKLLNSLGSLISRGKRDNALKYIDGRDIVRKGIAQFLGVWYVVRSGFLS
jgi:hypothetical protein